MKNRPRQAPRLSSRLYIRLAPERSRLFRYLLEAYDNLAYTSVIDRKEAVLKITFSPQQEGETLSALEEIRASLPFEILPLPLKTADNNPGAT